MFILGFFSGLNFCPALWVSHLGPNGINSSLCVKERGQLAATFLEARASHGPGPSVTQSVGRSHFSISLFYIASIVPYGPVCSPVVPYGSLWSSMGPYGSLWSSMVLYGPLWSSMVPFGPLLSPMVLYGTLWLPMVLYGTLWS